MTVWKLTKIVLKNVKCRWKSTEIGCCKRKEIEIVLRWINKNRREYDGIKKGLSRMIDSPF